MTFQSILAARRDGRPHSDAELEFLAQGAACGSIPDYQLSAWLMAAYLNPLSLAETSGLTRAMAASGERVDLTGVPKPWVDKHSTGGVGDKTTLVLLPLLAACGLTMVKMSGRGLGITGGTVDKLASIPGFRLDLSPEEMKAQALEIGLALTGQTPNLAPADKTLYALRDATETVASMPLIASSILSKKIAGGAERVVMDVKVGEGAFMTSHAEAQELARWLVSVGAQAGLPVHPVISDMSQPLGSAVGNALEVREAVAVLRNEPLEPSVARFRLLCVTLAGVALAAADLVPTADIGRWRAAKTLERGLAWEKAQAWITAQGGDLDGLPTAPVRAVLPAPASGHLAKLSARSVGEVVLALGGGRRTKEDVIDPAVGVRVHALVGDAIVAGQPLFEIHAASEDAARAAVGPLLAGTEIVAEQVKPLPLFHGL